jgi:hypothetical protein
MMAQLLPLRPAAVRAGIVLLLLGCLALDSAGIIRNQSYVTWLYGQERALAADLLAHGEHHIFTDYWTCDWIAFETGEHITCAVLDSNLRSSLDRYPPYRAGVLADRRAPLVGRVATPLVAFMDRVVRDNPLCYQRQEFPVFVIYRSRCRAPIYRRK